MLDDNQETMQMTIPTQATIRDLEDRRYRAMCDMDLATLEALLSDSLVYTHSSASTDSKTSYMEAFRSGKWAYKSVSRPVEDIQVHGDCAVVTGRAEIEVVVEGKARQLNSRYIDVWINGARGWQMVAWQSTPIPPKA